MTLREMAKEVQRCKELAEAWQKQYVSERDKRREVEDQLRRLRERHRDDA